MVGSWGFPTGDWLQVYVTTKNLVEAAHKVGFKKALRTFNNDNIALYAPYRKT